LDCPIERRISPAEEDNESPVTRLIEPELELELPVFRLKSPDKDESDDPENNETNPDLSET
jgi:hypothetical protein